MPTVDLTPYNQVQGSTSDGTKFDNLIAAIQTTINALDDANISPAAAIEYTKLALTGKLVNTDLSAAAAIAISKLAGYPADGTKALFGDGTWATVGAANVGTQLDYKQITADVTGITATTEGTAVAVITGNSITYDGSRNKVEVFCPASYGASATTTGHYVILRDSTVIGQFVVVANSATADTGTAVVGQVFDTPSAAAHIYKLAAFTGSAQTLNVSAGLGGTGNLLPAFLRVTKA